MAVVHRPLRPPVVLAIRRRPGHLLQGERRRSGPLGSRVEPEPLQSASLASGPSGFFDGSRLRRAAIDPATDLGPGYPAGDGPLVRFGGARGTREARIIGKIGDSAKTRLPPTTTRTIKSHPVARIRLCIASN